MVATMAPITWCDRRTMPHFSGGGRMLGESDPQEHPCGIGLSRGRMRAALGGNLGHRLGGWRPNLAHTISQFRHAGRISLLHVEITNATANQCPRIIVSVRDEAKIFT